MAQGKFLLTTMPSLLTYGVVDTPTLTVCGATGLPNSAPTELLAGNNGTGKPNNLPTVACNAPNNVLEAVLLPDRAAPMKPKKGDIMINTSPTNELAYANEYAMPE